MNYIRSHWEDIAFIATLCMAVLIALSPLLYTVADLDRPVDNQLEQIETEPQTETPLLQQSPFQEYKNKTSLSDISREVSKHRYNEAYREDKLGLNKEIRTLQHLRIKLVHILENTPAEYDAEMDKIVSPKLNRIDILLDKYYDDRDYVELWDSRMKEYPAATEVWLIMKSWGWNDAVCAGVIGNMMAEVGGQTLKLKACIYGGGGWYYGLCMWRIKYCPEIDGLDIPGQMNVLYNTIGEQFDYAGFCYRSGFGLDDFLNMTDPGEAAIAFAKVYERPASQYVNHRAGNAWRAYNYFCGG